MEENQTQFDAQIFVGNLTHRPGVYRMLTEDNEVLYVGKAKDLKKRVSTYFRDTGLTHRTRSMMSKADRVEVTVTHTETEALLLESNLIKRYRPRYNVLLRDDKSYPYVYVSTEQPYPRLAFYRGAKRGKGRYFGPYANAGAVRDTLNLLQKIFSIRQCEDSFFSNRTRPCLQYQIKRCTAPCVGFSSAQEYQADVNNAIQFLEGRSEEVIDALMERMEAASAQLDFERAAEYRDKISTLRRVSERQYISGERGDLDIIACAMVPKLACVQVFNIRAGLNLGNASFFPHLPPGPITESQLLTAFIGQYYLKRNIPNAIIVSHKPDDLDLLAGMLTKQSGHQVMLRHSVRKERARWLGLARNNAENSLRARLASKAGQINRIEAMREELKLEFNPQRMECFDISHTLGEATVASCVVFDTDGPIKSDYRHFNIKGIEPGDDYGAMRQALLRRYQRLKQGEGQLPDILFVDGGKGQVGMAEEVLQELQVSGVMIIGVAKGEGRRPGLETLIISGQSEPVYLASHSLGLHLIQQIRDEAHRFAITGHRQRRAKARTRSPLEQIPGLGPKRRRSLLKHFGGAQGVNRAGIEALTKVSGISHRLAQQIYNQLHAE